MLVAKDDLEIRAKGHLLLILVPINSLHTRDRLLSDDLSSLDVIKIDCVLALNQDFSNCCLVDVINGGVLDPVHLL